MDTSSTVHYNPVTILPLILLVTKIRCIYNFLSQDPKSDAVAQKCNNIFTMDGKLVQGHIPDKPSNRGLKPLALFPFFCLSGKWFM